MKGFIWAIGSSIGVSLVSLIGIFALILKEKILNKILILLIGFSAGGLIGGAFLHLIPESLEDIGMHACFLYVIIGFILFFILERYFHWRHCHEGKCDIHAFTYLNLIGDGIHNFADGLVIGASFTVSINFGLITSLVIIFHEIPQEIGDFGVLVYGGLSKARALFFNFLTAITCVVGAGLGFFLAEGIKDFSGVLLPVTAGGFIYIAACDLIPELHKQPGLKRASFSILAFILGILLIWLAASLSHYY